MSIAHNFQLHIRRQKRQDAQRRTYGGGHRRHTPEQAARHIAQSIALRLDEGLTFTWSDYGLADNPTMQALVNAAMQALRGEGQ